MKKTIAILIALGLAAPAINSAQAGQLIIVENDFDPNPFVVSGSQVASTSFQPQQLKPACLKDDSIHAYSAHEREMFPLCSTLPDSMESVDVLSAGEAKSGPLTEWVEGEKIEAGGRYWETLQKDFAFNFSDPKKRWFNLGAFSKHSGKRLDTGNDYNESNTGLGYEWAASERVNYGFGVYNNSYDATSVYASVFREFFSVGRLRGGLTAGLVTGYPRADVLPFLFPTLAYEHDRIGVNLSYSPSISNKGEQMTTDVLMMQVKFAF